ncbi:MAG: hypothetical protein KF802_05245 [Bdellovibrionaceae bacterium]|nr:hypothetical protein [Pseudobdellovibrionaceae bacterium]
MDRKTWLVSVLVAMGLVLAADYFFLHLLFPLKKAALMEEMNRDVEEHLRENPTEPPPTPDNDPEAAPAPEPGAKNESSFRKSVQECFKGQVSARDPKDLLRGLKRQGLVLNEVTVENWHVRRPNGQEERIMVVASDRENANGRKEVRLFGVDDEGLPVPKPLPAAKAFDPKEDFIAALKKPGRLVFHQRQESHNGPEGLSASVEWVNEDVRDLQVFLKEKTLSCRDSDCRCL